MVVAAAVEEETGRSGGGKDNLMVWDPVAEHIIMQKDLDLIGVSGSDMSNGGFALLMEILRNEINYEREKGRRELIRQEGSEDDNAVIVGCGLERDVAHMALSLEELEPLNKDVQVGSGMVTLSQTGECDDMGGLDTIHGPILNEGVREERRVDVVVLGGGGMVNEIREEPIDSGPNSLCSVPNAEDKVKENTASSFLSPLKEARKVIRVCEDGGLCFLDSERKLIERRMVEIEGSMGGRSGAKGRLEYSGGELAIHQAGGNVITE
ncbi:hypothetical protein PIB30_086150 [Stylosanthes scabra]|uniref:Uncharacterized protein n=1 Tax=Stylosanthes scabra TaxID=79078 RepID=A0ABU6VSV2_9FABA|nr:hypothetical protein [Stylosanthes scabra]